MTNNGCAVRYTPGNPACLHGLCDQVRAQERISWEVKKLFQAGWPEESMVIRYHSPLSLLTWYEDLRMGSAIGPFIPIR